MATKEKKPKAEIPKSHPLVDYLRGALWGRKAADKEWGTSKHHDSHYYPSVSERRAKKRQERQNRKAARR